SSKVADAIVAASSSEFKDVQFGGDAVLRGVRVTREENDGLQIEAVWKLNSDRREIRFLNLLSVENKILKRGSANQAVFSNLEPQETVIDRVKIERDDLKGVEKMLRQINSRQGHSKNIPICEWESKPAEEKHWQMTLEGHDLVFEISANRKPQKGQSKES
ncbi:hypothetical protein N9Z53_05205, partial [Mariniblastus sp.]|nr:hypothetical protein [Mariniblastus sp.]